METAKALIDLNKEMKGGKINIYPLDQKADFTVSEKLDLSNEADVILLKSHVAVKKELEGVKDSFDRLIDHVLKNSMVIRTHELAMQYAKKYNATCVTPAAEIVYAGGFITKCGFCDLSSSKISLYERYYEEADVVKHISEMLANKKQIQNHGKDQNLKILRKIQENIIEKDQVLRKLKNLKADMVDHQSAIIQTGKLICSQEENSKEIDRDLNLIQKDIEYNENCLKNGRPQDLSSSQKNVIEVDLGSNSTKIDQYEKNLEVLR